MKKNLIIVLVTFVIGFSGCVKDLEKEGIRSNTRYSGRVIEKSENAPMKGVTVSVSDGSHVHASSTTNEEGRFEMDVNFDELNEHYMLHLDCANYPSMTEALKGMGQESFDYRDIVFFDKGNTTDWPRVTTKEISNITSNSAKSGGVIAYTGTAPITARGVCWGTSHDPTIEDNHSSDGTGAGEFVSNLTNLDLNTNYFVRAYATNQHGTYYGEEQSFVTADGLPTVVLNENSFAAVSSTSLSCSAEVTSNGGYSITGKGVCWNTIPLPTIYNSHSNDGSGNGYYNAMLTDLNPSNTYYIRAYATNAAGTAYSEQYIMTADHLNYLLLPRFHYMGDTFVVYSDDGNSYSVSEVEAYYHYSGCDWVPPGITLAGYGWRFPDENEINYMYQHKENIGGFSNTWYWFYWLDYDHMWTYVDNDNQMIIDLPLMVIGRMNFSNGAIELHSNDNASARVRLIRKED